MENQRIFKDSQTVADRANLMTADLSEAMLLGAYLSESDLYTTDLTLADLRNADLTSALIWKTDLGGTHFADGKFGETILADVDLSVAKGLDKADHTGPSAKLRRSRHIGDFPNWEDHDSYQKAFERLLRDLKAEGWYNFGIESLEIMSF